MAMKTHKATAKRVRITSTGKVLKRKAGQDHFNSRESGNVTRNKRTDLQMHKTLQKTIKSLLPYNK
ncbi:MAG: 50S ribosomal protein L35 [Patescibacteria group bacterium]